MSKFDAIPAVVRDAIRDAQMRIEQAKRRTYGTARCAICNEVFTKYHWRAISCSEECARLRANARGRKYYAKNRKKELTRKRKYREKNREKINVRNRKYREENREELNARKRKYREGGGRK